MTLEQLRIFIAVAEREHVTEAAKALNLTQSATSAAVSALEERHDVKLFDRVGRRIVLTQAGRLFLAEAKAVLARAAQASEVLDDLTGMRRGALSLAASQTIGNDWLPPIMHRFHQAHPGIRLRLAIANTERVTAAVLDGMADLGFVEDRVEEAGLAIEAVARDELVLVVAKTHPLATTSPVLDTDLAKLDWVMREAGSGTRAILEAMLKGRGLMPSRCRVALELPSNEAVRAAVEAGAGASLLSRLVAASGLSAGTLAALDLPVPGRDFYALRHGQRHESRAVQAFLAVVREEGKRRPGGPPA